MRIDPKSKLYRFANSLCRLCPVDGTVSVWEFAFCLLVSTVLWGMMALAAAKVLSCMVYALFVWILYLFGTPIHYERMSRFWADAYDAGSCLNMVALFMIGLLTLVFSIYRYVRDRPSNFWLFRFGDAIVRTLDFRVTVAPKSKPTVPSPGDKND